MVLFIEFDWCLLMVLVCICVFCLLGFDLKLIVVSRISLLIILLVGYFVCLLPRWFVGLFVLFV